MSAPDVLALIADLDRAVDAITDADDLNTLDASALLDTLYAVRAALVWNAS